MEGGRILGEGVDGCILATPMWPCAAGTVVGKDVPPNPKDPNYVSKIVPKKDGESEFLRAAARILGPEVSMKYLAGMKSECAPANSAHPPDKSELAEFQDSKAALLSTKKIQACRSLKGAFQSSKGITSDMKVMHITRYPMTCVEWANKMLGITEAYPHVLKVTQSAIPDFLRILQMFVQGREQLIHTDLHTNNIFVRPFSNDTIQFGIADFGRCYLRQTGVVSPQFFGGYLCEYIVRYDIYTGFSQMPLEARILNYCYRKHVENRGPSALIKEWYQETLRHPKSNDPVLFNLKKTLDYLTKRPLFIAMLEHMISIVKKLRATPTDPVTLTRALTASEVKVVEYILTRYTVLMPINTIAETVVSISDTGLTDNNPMAEFIIRAVSAPYEHGSSLASELDAVIHADLSIAWSDVMREFSS